jgi:hypothetical protein
MPHVVSLLTHRRQFLLSGGWKKWRNDSCRFWGERYEKRKIVRGRIREQQLSLYGVLEISRMKSSQEFVSLEAKGTEFPVTKRRQNT